jgi:8-oxo-dGTP diphosphatase
MRRGAVAVIIEQGRWLAIRRSWEVSAPGKVCFPGGGMEPNETEAETIVRELREELNLSVRPLQRLWENVTPWKVHLAWWLAERIDDEPPRPLPAEVAEVFWLSADEMTAHPDLLPSNLAFFEALQRGEIVLPQ